MRDFVPVALAAALLAGAACGSGGPVGVSLDMPGIAVLPPGSFGEIIVTDFAETAPPPDFAPGLELPTYLAAEIGRVFAGPVSRATVPAEAAAGPAPPSFWKEKGAGHEAAVFLTGSVRLTGQVRKAVDRVVPIDRLLNPAGSGLIEQLRWTMAVDVFLVSAATGEVLHRTSLREDRDYNELDKPVEFAFSDLSERIRSRLFPALLGASTIERRALLRR
jgi:hypothetical protein